MKYVYILFISLIVLYFVIRYFENYSTQENFDPSLVPVSSIITLAKIAQRLVDGSGNLIFPANFTLGTATAPTNLTVTGTSTIGRSGETATNLTVNGAESITGNSNVGGTLNVTGPTALKGGLAVTGNTTNTGTLAIGGTDPRGYTLGVNGSLGVTGNTGVIGTLGVSGATTLGSTLGVTGATTLGSTLGVTGMSNLNGGATITGNTTNTGTLSVNGNTTIGLSTVPVSLKVNGYISSSDFISTNTSLNSVGPANIGTTLGVNGMSTLRGGATITGNTTNTGTLAVTGATTLNGGLNVPANGAIIIGGLQTNGLNVTTANSQPGNAVIAGNTNIGKDLIVAGNTNVTGAISASDFISTSKSLNSVGDANIGGNLKVIGGFNLIPRGSIMMWYGTTAPAGWVLCDGQNGTPDMRNRLTYGGSGSNTGATTTFTGSTGYIAANGRDINPNIYIINFIMKT